MILIDINTSNLLTLSSDAISHCHTKKNKNVKMSRCQDVKLLTLAIFRYFLKITK